MKNNVIPFISNILCIKFKIWAALQRCSPSYMWGLAFYSREKYLHYRIISLRVVVWGPLKGLAYTRSLLLTTVWRYQRGNKIKVPVLSQEGERSCIWVVGVLILYLCFYDCSIWFRNCSDSMVLFVFHFNTRNRETFAPSFFRDLLTKSTFALF